MYICVCNAVTDRDIQKAIENGATSFDHLQDELKVATCCGRCANCAKSLLDTCCNKAEAA